MNAYRSKVGTVISKQKTYHPIVKWTVGAAFGSVFAGHLYSIHKSQFILARV